MHNTMHSSYLGSVIIRCEGGGSSDKVWWINIKYPYRLNQKLLYIYFTLNNRKLDTIII